MVSSKFEMFGNRLQKVYKHVTKWANKHDISCYRFYDHDLPEFPFVLERYGDVVHGAEYRRKHGMEAEEHDAWLAESIAVISRICQVSTDKIYLKERRRITQRPQQYSKVETQKVEKIVSEAGLSFIINLTDYLDTGLFLDHRITRQLFREAAPNKKVLNLFCYTGSFNVYAASGGAASITAIDLSATYIHWAKRNLQYNKLYDSEKHRLLQADVLQWLQQDEQTGYDLVFCDPPTFSNSKRMQDTFDVQGDHVHLLNSILKKMNPGGTLIFSNNFHDFVLDEAALTASSIKNITGITTPLDFQGKLKRVCYRIIK